MSDKADKSSKDDLTPQFPKGLNGLEGSDNVDVVKDDSDVSVVVSNVYCPNGHNLVSVENTQFDNCPGIKLKIEAGGKIGYLTLSPIHGDTGKDGFEGIPEWTDCKISCPECGVEMPVITRCSCGRNGRIYALYLTKKLGEGEMVGICSLWGCHKSKIIDNFEIISEIINSENGQTWDL